MSPSAARNLPGDLTPRQRLEQIIRVDHAGEYGAMRIYAGQLAVLKDAETVELTRHMMEQERHHLDTFEKLMVQHRVRPTALMPLWHVAGYVMGAATALIGKEAAHACTVAVESVINEHYASQQKTLPEGETNLSETIERFRAEEMEHHDTALAQGAQKAPFYGLLHGAVAGATRLAIFLSSRI